MKNITTIVLLLSFGACAQTEVEPKTIALSPYNSPTIDREVALNDPYDIDFTIERFESDQFYVVVTVNPKGGSFFVSPHSKQDFKGVFRVEVSPNQSLQIGNDFMETPRSKEVIDNHPFIQGSVNWVMEETTYKYPLILNTDKDFEIGGRIVFVIEPKCTLEEIPVMFKFKDGKLTAENWNC